MTDAELTRALAGVMGWEVYTDEVDWRIHCLGKRGTVIHACCVKEDGSVLVSLSPFGIRPWRPLHSMDDAWMVVERMKKDGWHYELASCFGDIGDHHMLLMRGVCTDGDFEQEHFGLAPTPQRAIALAALAACGGEVPE